MSPRCEKFVSAVNRRRFTKGNPKNFGRIGSERHVWKKVVFAALFSVKPMKTQQNQTCLQCSIKNKKVRLNDKQLAGIGLLQGLIDTIFRFPQGLIARTDDIKAVFLQANIPEQERNCFRLK